MSIALRENPNNCGYTALPIRQKPLAEDLEALGDCRTARNYLGGSALAVSPRSLVKFSSVICSKQLEEVGFVSSSKVF